MIRQRFFLIFFVVVSIFQLNVVLPEQPVGASCHPPHQVARHPFPARPRPIRPGTRQSTTNELTGKAKQLFELAKASNPERVQFALDKGARVIPTPDGESFAVSWEPSNPAENKPVMIALHGSTSFAFDEFYLWYPSLEKHGVAIIALQWWFGETGTGRDYYLVNELYPIMETFLRERGQKPGTAILQGFSRGSANSYGVTYFDRDTGNNYFGMTFALSGSAELDFPLYADIESGELGEKVFAGTHWALFCGGKDPNPEKTGCPGMERTADWLKKHGGSIDLMFEDPDLAHGGFNWNSEGTDKFFTYFQQLISGQPAQNERETFVMKGICIGSMAGNEAPKSGSYLMPNIQRLDNGSYRMYYNRSTFGDDQIKYAESPDGITWTVKGIVLKGSSNPTDLTFAFGGPSVVRLADGRYRMYIRCSPKQEPNMPPKHHIISAISNDGVTFTQEPGVRIEIASNDPASQFQLAGHGAFYRLKDGTFAAIFSANLVSTSNQPSDLYLGTSPDGLTWGNFKMLYKGFHDPTVVEKDGKFYLYTMYLHFFHARGISEDGITWPETLDEILLADDTGTDLTVARAGVGDLGAAIAPDGNIRIYSNYGNPSEQIAYFDLKSSSSTSDNPPTVRVNSPNGGEQIALNSPLSISWASSDDKGISSHAIALSSDGGGTFPTTLATGLSGSATSFSATLSATISATTRARVRVTATDSSGKTGSDTSDADFSITAPNQADTVAPTVQLVSPNGGEQATAGANLMIRWNSSDNVAVRSQTIHLSTDGGAAFAIQLATGLPGNATSFAAQLPSTLATTRGRVRVSATDQAGNSGSDMSEADFTITVPAPDDTTPPSVRLIAPNGGEKLKLNQSFLIQWQSSDNLELASHDLFVSTDGGVSYPNLIATGLPASAQSFAFTVPSNMAKTKMAKVRVVAVDKAGNRGQDDSDATFRVKK